MNQFRKEHAKIKRIAKYFNTFWQISLNVKKFKKDDKKLII